MTAKHRPGDPEASAASPHFNELPWEEQGRGRGAAHTRRPLPVQPSPQRLPGVRRAGDGGRGQK